MNTRNSRIVAVVVPQPPGYIHARALLDLAEPLTAGLRDLGFDAQIATTSDGFDRCIIVGPGSSQARMANTRGGAP